MRHSLLIAALLGIVVPTFGEDARVLPGVIEPVAAPDLVVPDEIVVEFDAVITGQLEALRTAGGLDAESVPVLGDRAFDGLVEGFGVAAIRKQFPGAEREAALRAGLPDLSGYYVVRFDASRATLDEVLAAFAATPGVVHVERIGIHPVDATPNDGNYSAQWHLNTASDHDLDAPEAWNLETGDPGVIAAVLDTGVRYFHKDLGGSAASYSTPTNVDGNMWVNWAEKNGTAGVDDDGNGYVDDWVGWDWVTGVTGCWSGEDCSTADNDPRDFNGHGTHCAGNVAALNNNGYAVAAPAGGWGNGTLQPTGNGVKVMGLRIGWSGSSGGTEVGYVRMDFAASAFYYAANNGASIASCSWGSSNSGGVGAAVDYFIASGGLVFKAAGNSNNQTADYLCARSDVYCVAATDSNDLKASFSSYGTWVDISAPGVSIYSTYHNHSAPSSDYVAAISGTSMATPLTASAAALIWSQNPTWSAGQVWARLRDTADPLDGLNPAYVGKLGSGRVNLYNALNTAPECETNADCSDGNDCNGIEVCVGGVCEPGPLTADCNGNGIEDACDIAGGTANDCNYNGVPDSCDVASGTSLDCNANTVPDECDIYGGWSEDCNGNGVPDECDLAGGTALDCNNNDVPDSCDIAAGTSQDANGNGVPDECEAAGEVVLLTFTGGTTVPTIGTVQDEDIVSYDTGTGVWALYFDGSDVGLSAFAIDALALLPSGELLISVDVDGTLAGLSGGPNGTNVDDSDIVKFTPTSLGANTAGNWTFYFDGSDVGLTQSTEDIDALELTADGKLLISTTGAPSVSGLSGLRDEDVLQFTPTTLGAATAGTWAYYFDGSDVGLSTSSEEDVDALTLTTAGNLRLSTVGNFSVTGASGADEDVFEFTPTSLGSTTAGTFGMFLDLSALGIPTTADVIAAELLP